jgi:hypothetical protein
MNRKMDIPKLNKAGFVVRSNFKKEVDVIERKDGGMFTLWVGGNTGKVAINRTVKVTLDKDFDSGEYDTADGSYGTLFRVNIVELHAGRPNLFLRGDKW